MRIFTFGSLTLISFLIDRPIFGTTFLIVLIPHLIATCSFGTLFVSCESGTSERKSQPSNIRETPVVDEEAASPKLPSAKEVNRFEFVESELLPHPEDEKEFNHLYMGSSDGYDYITVRGKIYKIASDEIGIDRSFPFTNDSRKWLQTRIHFSQIKYKEG